MFSKWPLELIIWSAGLLLLAFSCPDSDHFTLCPLANAGISWCPGCGLGRSVSYLLHGELERSLNQHWFGIPAFIILIHRVMRLLNKFLLNLEISSPFHYGKRSIS